MQHKEIIKALKISVHFQRENFGEFGNLKTNLMTPSPWGSQVKNGCRLTVTPPLHLSRWKPGSCIFTAEQNISVNGFWSWMRSQKSMMERTLSNEGASARVRPMAPWPRASALAEAWASSCSRVCVCVCALPPVLFTETSFSYYVMVFLVFLSLLALFKNVHVCMLI